MDAGPTLTVYASREAHSSVDKGVKLAGYGLDRLRRIPGDAAFALDPAALERRDRGGPSPPGSRRRASSRPSARPRPPRWIRCPPSPAICRRHGIWLHVDAAYAGSAAIVPELRRYFAGMDAADSIVLNPHKWLLTNFDCTAYYVRDRDALLRDVQPDAGVSAHRARRGGGELSGLGHSARPAVPRAQALVRDPELRCRRVSSAIIRRHVALAAELAGWVDEADDFERVAPVPFGLVCFRYRPAGKPEEELDALNERLLRAVNATGRVFLTHTRLAGRYVDPAGDRTA